MQVCDHCLAEVKDGNAILEETDGPIFCCTGCQGIYHILQESGLHDFYKRRNEWAPGPNEIVYVSPDVFRDSVSAVDGEKCLDISIFGIRCASCVWLIERFLTRSIGVTSASINYATHRARIRWDPLRTDLPVILNSISSIGYSPLPYSSSFYNELVRIEKKDMVIRLGAASFFSMQIMMLSVGLYAGYFQGIDPGSRKMIQVLTWLLATPVMFYSGYPFIRNTIIGLRSMTVNMDTLVFLGSFSSYAYSIFMIFKDGEVYFDTSSMIITLILLGRVIDSGMKGKASEAISLLMSLQTKEARLLLNEKREKVPISTLKTGDLIEVIPGEAIPLDCEITDGESEVDESMLSGESMPVRKGRGAEVFAGTMNLNGRLILTVKRVGKDTVLSGIIRAVEEAGARKAPIQGVAERIIGWFVPAVLSISVLTFFIWYKKGAGIGDSMMNSVSILVIACPCALGLATSLAMLSGSTVLLKRGILVRGWDVLETAAQVDTVVFDKTGTLTSGRPSLSEIHGYEGTDREEIHRLAGSLEACSEHAIATALCEGIKDAYPVKGFRASPGMGIEGHINGTRYFIGNTGFLRSSGISITEDQTDAFLSMAGKGNTVIGLGREGGLIGWLAVSDTIRPEAGNALDELKKLGCETGMLTGDNGTAARRIGKEAGISGDSVVSGVTPLQKGEEITKLKRKGFNVMMVGDGINDAPALTEADAGVAMGKGTDIAKMSSGIVLMRNDLTMIPFLIRVSRKTLSVTRQNLFWAFSYNLIAIPLAASGDIHPIASASFMALSSLVVTWNSLRLRRSFP